MSYENLLYAVDDRVERGHSIVHPRALTAGLDQPGAPQVAQVPRGGRLRQAKRVVNIADADFAFDEHRQHAKASGIG